MHERYKRRIENYLSLTKDLSTESIDTRETTINDAERNTFLRTESDDDSGGSRNRLRSTIASPDTVAVSDIEDLCKPPENDKKPRSNEYCNTSFACSGPSRQQCQELVRDYHQRQQLEFREFYHGIQSFRHTVVLILLLCSMFVVSIFFRLNNIHMMILSFRALKYSDSRFRCPFGLLSWMACLAFTLNCHFLKPL